MATRSNSLPKWPHRCQPGTRGADPADRERRGETARNLALPARSRRVADVRKLIQAANDKTMQMALPLAEIEPLAANLVQSEAPESSPV